jgi:uncharacterized protein (TIGR04255 family)
MGAQLPTTLGKSPLLEALFEIRFQASRPAAGDLLPGIFFSALQEKYPDVISLPLARVPRDLRENDVNFLYQPSHQLVGKTGSIQIGDRVLALAVQVYPGWSEFKMQAEQLVDSGEKTGLIENVERYSFRYINVIPVREGQPQLQTLNAKIELGEASVLERGFQLRAEFDDEDFTSIVQVVPNSIAQPIGGEEVSGLIIDIDTHRSSGDVNFFEDRSQLLEDGHNALKRLFFSLISDQTLLQLEPSYS